MMLEAIDWILRQCAEATIVCALYRGDLPSGVIIDRVYADHRGVIVNWSHP